MATWETDDEYTTKALGAASLSSPGEPIYRKTSVNSKRSARRSMTPPARGSSPPSMSSDRTDKRLSRDITTDETVSILDPRRFTPTLHANLVSEILALRRDQEEKNRQIESLENTLHSVKVEHELLQENFATTAKESRSLKRQLSLLEGGSASALGELAKERDEAVDSITDTKKRLEAAQKKVRAQEDDSQRVHELWGQEKNEWEDERRKYERKLHIADSRLKVVLDEVAAYQASHANVGNNGANEHDSDAGEESSRDNDVGSIRTMSMTNSIRHSVLHGLGIHHGHSLADELNFDDDDHTDGDGRESVLSNRTSPKHARTYSREGVSSRLHNRNRSIDSLKRPGSVARGKLFMNAAVLEALEGEDDEAEMSPTPKSAYIDTGVQFSPPPSPDPRRMKSPTPETVSQRVKTFEAEHASRTDSEVEANQRKKRVHINQRLSIEPSKPENSMVSAAAQTVEMPLSPPKTPQTPFADAYPAEAKRNVMMTASTQTEASTSIIEVISRSSSGLAPSPPPMLPIPSINVQPPTSRPTTPREPRLPQHFKHFGCQVNLSSLANTSDASVQTEGIQVDKRIALLPRHLQPSNISSRPTSPNISIGVESDKAFTPVPARNPRRLANNRSSIDIPAPSIASPEEGARTDDKLLLSQDAIAKRTIGLNNIYAGFDTASSDEADEFGDVELSDSEYRTALSAPKPQSVSSKPAKRSTFGMSVAPSDQSTAKSVPKALASPFSTEPYSSFSLTEKQTQTGQEHRVSRAYEKFPTSNTAPASLHSSNRTSAIRRAAMIQSGIASQQSRSRSPSLPDGVRYPPYPIPNRASSRRSQLGIQTPSDGRRSPTRADAWLIRGSSRSSYRSQSIRKVRSAAALPRSHRGRKHGSRSPPPLSPSTEAPESPGLPPLPKNDITTPRMGRDRGASNFRRHRHELSTNTDNTNNTVPTTDTSASHTTGVVDAIAQTMVGEWMLKYVRRRKSFSVAESNGRDDSSNDRHKRWVWLAPYERSILWSSKQPSSGSALLGKTGRKLTIQSVLDVKDDNPAPKVLSPVFNRSILILTPQRALKFTAVSAERHYLWLTALSFLAHSSQAVPEIISAPHPNVKQQGPAEFELPQAKVKRNGIRDSIRLAKGRSNVGKIGAPSVPSMPSVPSSRMSEATGGSRIPGSSSVVSGPHSREDSREVAEPPFIPRFGERSGHAIAHGRKRSNTGGHVAPPLSFRGFSGPAGSAGHSTTNGSVDTAASSDLYQTYASPSTTWNMSQPASQRTSDVSSRPSNFFDAIGTVRMEAFISPLANSQYNEHAEENDEFRTNVRRRSKEIRRRNSRSRRRDNFSVRAGRGDDYYGRGRSHVEEDYFLRDDPFKGF